MINLIPWCILIRSLQISYFHENQKNFLLHFWKNDPTFRVFQYFPDFQTQFKRQIWMNQVQIMIKTYFFSRKSLIKFSHFFTIFDPLEKSNFDDKPHPKVYFDEISANLVFAQKSEIFFITLLKKCTLIFTVWVLSRSSISI